MFWFVFFIFFFSFPFSSCCCCEQRSIPLHHRRRRRALFFFFSSISIIFSHSDAISRPPDRVMFYLSTFCTAQFSLSSPPPPPPIATALLYIILLYATTTAVTVYIHTTYIIQELSCVKKRSQLGRIRIVYVYTRRVLEFRRHRSVLFPVFIFNKSQIRFYTFPPYMDDDGLCYIIIYISTVRNGYPFRFPNDSERERGGKINFPTRRTLRLKQTRTLYNRAIKNNYIL